MGWNGRHPFFNLMKISEIFKSTDKVYLSGPISTYGNEDHNRAIFRHIKEIIDQTCSVEKVFNPAELPKYQQWSDYLKRDIMDMIHCSFIIMLPDWYLSRGAQFENVIAAEIGITRLYVLLPFDLTSENLELGMNPQHRELLKPTHDKMNAAPLLADDWIKLQLTSKLLVL